MFGLQGGRVPTPQQQAAFEAHLAQGRALAEDLGLSGNDGLMFLRLTPQAQQRVLLPIPAPPHSAPKPDPSPTAVLRQTIPLIALAP